jgi:hypothetical protein
LRRLVQSASDAGADNFLLFCKALGKRSDGALGNDLAANAWCDENITKELCEVGDIVFEPLIIQIPLVLDVGDELLCRAVKFLAVLIGIVSKNAEPAEGNKWFAEGTKGKVDGNALWVVKRGRLRPPRKLFSQTFNKFFKCHFSWLFAEFCVDVLEN